TAGTGSGGNGRPILGGPCTSSSSALGRTKSPNDPVHPGSMPPAAVGRGSPVGLVAAGSRPCRSSTWAGLLALVPSAPADLQRRSWMKAWVIVLALAGSVLGCAATRETVVNAPPEQAADVEAVKGAVSGFYDAQNAVNVDAFMVLIAEDGRIDSVSQGGKVAK